MVFPNQITLKESKRLKTIEQRQKLKQLKEDIFNSNKPIFEVLKKYGFKTVSEMKEVKTKNNICYFNFRADAVNKQIHSQVKCPENAIEIGGVNYWAGLEIVCNRHYKDKKNGVRLFVNYTYKIESIGEKFFVIKDEVEDERITLNIKMLDYFKLPYAGTCHSVQGLSIKDEMTLFDVNTPYVDKYFIWTALTRATDFGGQS